ncbi:biosynthetic arginine decarboxylase [Crocosphaera sp. UHCC 0190]|uniref:biosynthetic arginine decarboxylase n=1 Tax=Crocosphaera sp. UHCC 0190 TaxID=3110246 RepID=UPI002B1F6F73|nr:biosynthetic arginine decarboxylase [Crocosphaera sp. UHCC 0190]MEA5510345.1 biosynthetic arginine decarboxylase [Crocosphaera sp. UHCC 0190]
MEKIKIEKATTKPTESLKKLDIFKAWTIEDSENLYRINEWGNPYFSINAAGHIMVSPQGERGSALDLYHLIEGLRQRNIGLPLLIRFSDILADRLERLQACFNRSIARYNYANVYRGVYPIKCNQHRHIIEAIVNSGKPYKLGLEAGSKPELMIALATLDPQENTQNDPALLICNGYKDREYLETALLGKRLGHYPIIVIEQLKELYLTLKISRNLNIKPILGVRVKLCTKGSGRWGNSTGDRAKFGLTIPEILTVIKHLQALEMLDCLQLLHFHIGSQIASIGVIKNAMREASQIYVQLAQAGANMKYLDVGGGLAVDYDGSKTNFYASKNYNMQNYANDIVAAIQEACDGANIAVPTLITESGRAMAAHHSILVFDVLSTHDVSTTPPPAMEEKENLIIRNLWETYESISLKNYQETYHDALQFKEEAISLFNFGYLTLQERARAEQLYWACCGKIMSLICHQDYVPDDLEDLEKILASIYYVNLSVFQSAPDSWAIDQLFPIMPIHRLEEEPKQRGILADLTCDSDGKIDQFIDREDVKSVLELHSLNIKEIPELQPQAPELSSCLSIAEPYYLGMFLIGAYQEIMGNFHNLFGDINVVHISMNPKGYQIEHIVKGDTIKQVLGYVQYDGDDLLEAIRRQTEQGLQDNKITLEESQQLLKDYEDSLTHYTYLVADEIF